MACKQGIVAQSDVRLHYVVGAGARGVFLFARIGLLVISRSMTRFPAVFLMYGACLLCRIVLKVVEPG
ncbi:hypothetical protein EI42_01129 [Thermosporothrix hazakensis]|jgi:hypothetical protein|uniref:Uncharacterized protein n=1 Tax=Thermosporothrix hazakensis TaxID=644383 RepID=A0A326UBB9_THEHA|nr:hypothetical protein [Thermosporothrix hazakensis]PZW34292.1 hypothetical protein EI42_01129 [Thermosporothrix hazakensis]GCE46155.1 hypothetical protein KTH_10240 [Thermosporothrix hazakensis]